MKDPGGGRTEDKETSEDYMYFLLLTTAHFTVQLLLADSQRQLTVVT